METTCLCQELLACTSLHYTTKQRNNSGAPPAIRAGKQGLQMEAIFRVVGLVTAAPAPLAFSAS